jgi:hypothetical protein
MASIANAVMRWGVALSCLAAGAASAAAQEYCVVCTEPAAMYRCVIENPQPGAAQSLQVLCVTSLARESGHGQCSVQRGVTVFQCDGPVKRVSAGAPATPVVTPSAPAAPAPQTVPEAPKTVVEAAKRAQDATADSIQETNAQLRRAGEATFGFLRDTAVCIGTLFTRCGGAKPAP